MANGTNLPVLTSELRDLTFKHLFASPGTRQIFLNSKHKEAQRSSEPTALAQPYIARSLAAFLEGSSPNSCTLSLVPELSRPGDARIVVIGAVEFG